MNANIKAIVKVDTLDLQEQFRLCEQWNDSQQWDWLALAYYSRGYVLNALHCFKRADAIRAAFVPVPVEVEVVHV